MCKFFNGQTVIHLDSAYIAHELIVVRSFYSYSLNDWEYCCVERTMPNSTTIQFLKEDLMSLQEYQTYCCSSTVLDECEYKVDGAWTLPEIKCTCGAHKVRDARHSNWCDIKN